VASYESALDTLTNSSGATRRWSLSTIAVLDSDCQLSHSQNPDNNNSAYVSVIGQRYVQMSQDTQGYQGSICDASYATSLSNIASQIATLTTQFFLNQVPVVSSISVTVNGSPVAEDLNNGWQYSVGTNSVMFFGSAIPPQGATITVSFTPTNPASIPLVISNYQISNITNDSVTVTWTTNDPSNSQVSIAAYPSTNFTTTTDNTMTTNHSETITGLSNFTVYDIYITSTDGYGNTAATPPQAFRTLN
jgi:hypothetical protein